MPAPRRRSSSLLGHMSSERPVATPSGARVTRRALGISSVFLQGTRSSPAPVTPRTGLPPSGLSWTLLDYKDKVETLERLNLELQRHIEHVLEQRAHSATCWRDRREEWERGGAQVSDHVISNAKLLLETENVQNDSDDFRERLSLSLPLSRQLEDDINSLNSVINEASETRRELQSRYDDLWAELQQLQLQHQQDVQRLYPQDLETPGPDQSSDRTGLDQILDRIRRDWERVCEENRREREREKEEVLVSHTPQQKEVESLRSEVQEAMNKLQRVQTQTESLRALKAGLDTSLSDARRWQEAESQSLGQVVSRLEAELGEVMCEVENQRRDLETLVTNKHTLEQEVQLYHALLGEGPREDQGEGPQKDQGEGPPLTLDQALEEEPR